MRGRRSALVGAEGGDVSSPPMDSTSPSPFALRSPFSPASPPVAAPPGSESRIELAVAVLALAELALAELEPPRKLAMQPLFAVAR